MIRFTPEQHQALADICRRYAVRRLELFGSAARDDFDPVRSDVDLLVTFDDQVRPDLFLLVDLEEELERAVGRPVDVVHRPAIERSRNAIRRKNILDEARPVYG